MLKEATQNYLITTKRNCITKLIIVARADNIDEFRKRFERIDTKLDDGCEIITEFYTEEQLSK